MSPLVLEETAPRSTRRLARALLWFLRKAVPSVPDPALDFRKAPHQICLSAVVSAARSGGHVNSIEWDPVDEDSKWICVTVARGRDWAEFQIPTVISAEWVEESSRLLTTHEVMSS